MVRRAPRPSCPRGRLRALPWHRSMPSHSLPAFPLGSHPGFTWSATPVARARWVREHASAGLITGRIVRSPASDGRFDLVWSPGHLYAFGPEENAAPSFSLLLGSYPRCENEGWAMSAALAAVSRTLSAEFGVELSRTIMAQAIDTPWSSRPARFQWMGVEDKAAPWPWRGSTQCATASASWLLTAGHPVQEQIWRRRLARWGVWQAVQVEATASLSRVTLYGLWRIERQPGSPVLVFRERQGAGGWKKVSGPDKNWPTWNLLGGQDHGVSEHAALIARAIAALANTPWDCAFTKAWWHAEAAQAFSPRRSSGSFLGRNAIRAIKSAAWAHLVDKKVLSLVARVHALGRPVVSWCQYLAALPHRDALARVALTHPNRLPLLGLLPVAEWSSPHPFALSSWSAWFRAAGEPALPDETVQRFLDWPASALQLAAYVGRQGGSLRHLAFFETTDWSSLPVGARRLVLRVWLDGFHEMSLSDNSAWSREDMGRWLAALTRSWYAASNASGSPGRSALGALAIGLRGTATPTESPLHLTWATAWRHLHPGHPWRALLQAHHAQRELEGVLPLPLMSRGAQRF